MDAGAGSILAYIFLVLCGAYFASAESAYAKVNKIKLKNAAEEGNRKAKRALSITNDFDRALTTILICNNIAHLSCSALATVVAAKVGGVVWATLVTTVIVFLCSETLPKSFACANSEKVALAFSGSLSSLMKIFRPVAFLFLKISAGISRLFGAGEDDRMTEEELDEFIENVDENGTLDEEQTDLLQSAVDYTNTKIEDVMTMREDIAFVDINAPAETVLETVKNTGFSRLLVCNGDLDHVIGVLPSRDYLRMYLRRGRVNVRRVMFPPRFAAPEDLIDDLCAEMRQGKQQFVVVREEGRTVGIATIEDFLEQLVGEIWDEYDEYDEDFIKLGGNYFRLSPKMKVREAFARMDCPVHLPAEIQKKTLEAWLRANVEGELTEDSSFTFENFAIMVGDLEDGTTLTSVVIRLCENEEEAKEEIEE